MAGFEFSIIAAYWPDFWRGTVATLQYSLLSLLLAISIGLVVALARISRARALQIVSRIYIDVIRGTPALIQIFFIYFGTPALGLNLSAPVAGVIALGVNSGAYLAEIFRAGIEGVDSGQWEAGRAIGMTDGQIMRRLILPQAAVSVVPPSTGEFTSLVKGTSLLSTVAITELTRVGQQIIGVTFRPIEAYVAVGTIYLVLNAIISQASVVLERRIKRW
jgi:His/Glu/Gln/Arg/opine family amino acid ABC transporter permease subunit